MKRFAVIVAQYGIAGVFLLAAYPKIMDAKNFAGDILAYDMVSWSVARWMAVWIPWLEGVTAVLILVGVWVRPAATVVAALTMVFIIAKASALLRGLQIDCGCFGYSDPLTGLDVVLDVVLLGGAVLLMGFGEQCFRWFRPLAITQNHPP